MSPGRMAFSETMFSQAATMKWASTPSGLSWAIACVQYVQYSIVSTQLGARQSSGRKRTVFSCAGVKASQGKNVTQIKWRQKRQSNGDMEMRDKNARQKRSTAREGPAQVQLSTRYDTIRCAWFRLMGRYSREPGYTSPSPQQAPRQHPYTAKKRVAHLALWAYL